VTIAVVAASLIGSRLAAAQQTALFEQQLDAAKARLTAAAATARAYEDSANRRRVALQPVDVGPIRVLTPAALAPTVHWAVQQALADIARQYGNFDEFLVEDQAVHPMSVQRATLSQARGNMEKGDTIEYLVGIMQPEMKRERIEQLFGDSVVLANAFKTHYVTAIGSHLSRSLTDWLGGWVSLDTGVAEDRAMVRIQLASDPMRGAQQCFRGDQASCMSVLSLHPVDVIAELYDAPGRRAAVAQFRGTFQVRRAAQAERCLGGNDKACMATMQDLHWRNDLFASYLRPSLVQEALILGGHGAAMRLIHASGTPSEQLALVAGVSIDSVVASWRHRILTANAPSVNLTPMIAAVSLGWIVLFSGLGLRSNRWR
jgi:hypothetical protein